MNRPSDEIHSLYDIWLTNQRRECWVKSGEIYFMLGDIFTNQAGIEIAVGWLDDETPAWFFARKPSVWRIYAGAGFFNKVGCSFKNKIR